MAKRCPVWPWVSTLGNVERGKLNAGDTENSGIGRGISLLELIQTSWKATKPLRGASAPGPPGVQRRAEREEFQVFSVFFFPLRNKQTLPGEEKRRKRRKEEFAGGGLSSVAAGQQRWQQGQGQVSACGCRSWDSKSVLGTAEGARRDLGKTRDTTKI